MVQPETTSPPPQSSLGRLLETEARLERMLEAARERASRRLQEAETQAQARLTALEGELAEAAIRMDRQRAADCDARLASMAREDELALNRLRNIGPERISDLARWVADQALAGILPGGGS